MKILSKSGSKERLFEMMNRVNSNGTKRLFESVSGNHDAAIEFADSTDIDLESNWEEYIDGLQDSIEHKRFMLNCEDCFYEWIENTYLTNQSESMNEDSDELNEISWEGIKRAGRYVKDKTTDKVNNAVDSVSNTISDVSDVVKQKVSDVGNRLQDIGNQIASEYHKGSKNSSVSKLEKIANDFGNDFGKMIAKINTSAAKAGEEQINVQSIAQSISNSIVRSAKSGNSSSVNLNKFKTESIDDYVPFNVGDINEYNIEYPQSSDDAEAMSGEWEETQDLGNMDQKSDIKLVYSEGHRGLSQLIKGVVDGQEYRYNNVDELNRKLSELGATTKLDPINDESADKIAIELRAMGHNAVSFKQDRG